MPARRFPPPWTVEDNGALFVVKGPGAGKRYSRSGAPPGRKVIS